MKSNPLQILIVEDDQYIVDVLKLGLEREGFSIIVAEGGKAGIDQFRKFKPGLVLLDLRLPDLNGEAVCMRLRAESKVPIIVVTCRERLADKVALFKLGVDDYIVKPFAFEELLVRIQALLRRCNIVVDKDLVVYGNMELRVSTRQIWRAGKEIDASAKEFDLLHLLMTNPLRVLTRESILEGVWGYGYDKDSNIVEVHIMRLRQKLGDPPLIRTIRGVGYSLRG